MKIEHDSRIVLKSALIRHLFGEDLDDDDLAKGDLINRAIHRYAAGVSSKLLAVRLSDLLGDAEPTNVPGTDDSIRTGAGRHHLHWSDGARTSCSILLLKVCQS